MQKIVNLYGKINNADFVKSLSKKLRTNINEEDFEEKGKELEEKLDTIAYEIENKSFQNIKKEDIETLKKVLNNIIINLEEQNIEYKIFILYIQKDTLHKRKVEISKTNCSNKGDVNSFI